MLGMRCEYCQREKMLRKDRTDLTYGSGLHGYTHEFVSTLSEKQQIDVLAKSIDVLTKFTGKKPKGWTAPAWDTSKQIVRLLEEFGIEYDHSFMHVRSFQTSSVRSTTLFLLRLLLSRYMLMKNH